MPQEGTAQCKYRQGPLRGFWGSEVWYTRSDICILYAFWNTRKVASTKSASEGILANFVELRDPFSIDQLPRVNFILSQSPPRSRRGLRSQQPWCSFRSLCCSQTKLENCRAQSSTLLYFRSWLNRSSPARRAIISHATATTAEAATHNVH